MQFQELIGSQIVLLRNNERASQFTNILRFLIITTVSIPPITVVQR